MAALETVTGLLKQTIPYYKKRNFVNISNSNPRYTAFPAIKRNIQRGMKEGWAQVNFGLPYSVSAKGGYQVEWNVQVTKGNTFDWVSQYDPVHIDNRDFQVRASVPWRLCRNHWSYNKWEMSACKGEQELTNLIVTKALGCDQDFADAFENWFWGAPPPSTDDKTAFPLRYWVFTEPESTGGSYSGFTGMNNAGTDNFLNLNHNSYTGGPGNISRVTYPQWGNFNSQYTSFTRSDFVEKFIMGCIATDFRSPVDFPDLVKDAPDRGCYTTRANLVAKMNLAQQQNDANTSDLASRIHDFEFFKVPFYAVPHLDSSDFTLYGGSNKDVVYMLDWSTLYWTSKTGFTLDDEVFEPTLSSPLDFTHVRYLGGNLTCIEPRRNAVFSK